MALCFSLPSFSATIAVLDSGIDFKHKCLKANQWKNPKEKKNSRDDDYNGYIDDLTGWNFITESYSPWKRNEFPKFPQEIFRYYQVRKKKTLDQATEAELQWYNTIRKKEEFKETLSVFKRFIHGTHIGGIASGCQKQESKSIKLMSIRYLGKAEKGIALAPTFKPKRGLSQSKGIKHIRQFSKEYARWQKRKLKTAVEYASTYAKVINGSFGTSMVSGRKYATNWYKEQFNKEIPDDLKEEIAREFVDQLIEVTEDIVDEFPGLLFVFSAGNANDDNDEFPHYPSDARRKNVISVGASFFFKEKAYFSNFGKKTVDVFAPGAAITSVIPDQKTLPVNGTSQAAPLVSNLAANIMLIAKSLKLKLTPALVKNIIVDTVDEKTDLLDKSVSGGIINFNRALYLVKKLKNYPYPSALLKARRTISDQKNLKEDLVQGTYFSDEFAQERLF